MTLSHAQRMVLEFAALCSSESHPLVVADFERYFAANQFPMPVDNIEAALIFLMNAEYMRLEAPEGSLPAWGFWTITPKGRAFITQTRGTFRSMIESTEHLLDRKYPDVGKQHREPVKFDVRVSEAALDAWWESLDHLIKAELFNKFWEPLEEQIEKEAAR
ncbi:hypothetical protein H7849_11790 [Alloacidobacterium dinghuense]|uniref:Uncharacterized protein n=1 Tax=Alloacidobacterium dinghuense TaxID=2763107 RepID=A0A7G8BPN7_9BACT|nr:hypothetical protein [Alloacidobacterium dinghuense]QNI34507.1 hypothetical protein H7849_11790 [Alloacidobacterium dinghuense]